MTATRWTLSEDEDGYLSIANDEQGPFASVWDKRAPIVCATPELLESVASLVNVLERWPGKENPEFFPEMKTARALLERLNTD